MRKNPLSIEEAARLYIDEGLSCVQIAKKYQCDHKTVLKRLSAAGVERKENGTFQKTKAYIHKTCPSCEKWFFVRPCDRRVIFCSLKCRVKSATKKVEKNCAICGVVFFVSQAHQGKRKHCSIDCNLKAYWSNEKGMTVTELEKFRNTVAPELLKKRKSSEYKKWRKEVLGENAKCSTCLSIEDLNVHHIKEFSKFPELALDPKNALVLCRICHVAHHKASRNTI